MNKKTGKTKSMLAYKGFDENWQCRGFKFEVGKQFKHDGDVKICSSGFHACEYPLDVFVYYSPAQSKYAVVEMKKPVIGHDSDTKIASASISIKAEISLPEMVSKAVDWVMSRIDSAATNTGYQSAATNTGDQSAATNTGYQSAATNTGDRSAATNTGYRSAATNTGDRSAATNTGDQSAATVNGENSVAIATGLNSKARASKGSAIVLCGYNEDGSLRSIRSAIAGRDEVKADTWYTLGDDGEFVEVEEEAA